MQPSARNRSRYLFGIAGLSLAFASYASAEPQWREYAYPDQQFAVTFPAPPAVTTIRSSDPDTPRVTENVYFLQADGGRFEVAVFDLLLARLDETTIIARAAASLRRNRDATVDIASEVQGHWGRFLSLRNTDGSHTMAAVYYRNERLYEIMATVPEENFAAVSSDMVRFQQSLRFTGRLRTRRFTPSTEGPIQNIGGRYFGGDGLPR